VGKNRGDDSLGDVPLGAADALGYRRVLPSFSTNERELSANAPDRQGFSRASGLTGDMDTSFPARARGQSDAAIALKSICAFWVVYLLLITSRAFILQFPDFWAMFARRVVLIIVGGAITFLVYLALKPLRKSSLNVISLVAALLCLPASILFAACNYADFYLYAPLGAARADTSMQGMGWGPVEMAVRSILDTSLSWYFLFAAWSALHVAMSYARQLRAADRRAGALAREAQDAQLRALRYQINPHFLFNTLNSLSSLILAQKTDVAEQMLMNLSTFFRATLSADPTADVSLNEEIRLQRLYLDIEQIRFPSRLAVEIDVPDALLAARVPVLILQPIVENAVKYGVARSRRPVTVRICAHEEAGLLHIEVSDDGNGSPPDELDEAGTGVGLRNVCERLETRFGSAGRCHYGPGPDGGFCVHLTMPVSINE
jgi:signal transduction histidine kinase